MAAIARRTDKDAGNHSLNQLLSPNVFIEGLAVAVVGSKYDNNATALTGSSTVFVNGIGVHRVGDSVTSGANVCSQGSPTVSAG